MSARWRIPGPRSVRAFRWGERDFACLPQRNISLPIPSFP